MRTKKSTKERSYGYHKYLIALIVASILLICLICSIQKPVGVRKDFISNNSQEIQINTYTRTLPYLIERNKVLLELSKRLPTLTFRVQATDYKVCELIIKSFSELNRVELSTEGNIEEDLFRNLSAYIEIVHKYSSIHKFCVEKRLQGITEGTNELTLNKFILPIEYLLGTLTLGIYIKYSTFEPFSRLYEKRSILFEKYKSLFEFYQTQMKIVTWDFITTSYELITFYEINLEQNIENDEIFSIQNILTRNGLMYRLFANSNIFDIISVIFNIKCDSGMRKEISKINIEIKDCYKVINNDTKIKQITDETNGDIIRYINMLRKYYETIDNNKPFNYQNNEFLKEMDRLNTSIMLNISKLFPKVNSMVNGTN